MKAIIERQMGFGLKVFRLIGPASFNNNDHIILLLEIVEYNIMIV